MCVAQEIKRKLTQMLLLLLDLLLLELLPLLLLYVMLLHNSRVGGGRFAPP